MPGPPPSLLPRFPLPPPSPPARPRRAMFPRAAAAHKLVSELARDLSETGARYPWPRVIPRRSLARRQQRWQRRLRRPCDSLIGRWGQLHIAPAEIVQ